ncbi:MAG TPA: serine hydrolase domain-containing protein [Bryobacteraceae bacterium]|nr:serine hydrolase domain-containing protein [Bryobacteraceae bacterium]
MRRLTVILAAAAILSLPALPASNTGGLTDTVNDILRQAVESSHAPSISVAIVQNGRLVYANAAGYASLKPERKATAETRYAVGSISKQFTVAAILLAVEQGKMSLDDYVSKYYPDLTRANEITIRELLSHTSGYEDYAPQDYMVPAWTKPLSPDALLNRWAKKPLDFDPGTKWQYSNTNFVLAGRIFEKAMGQPLVPFLQKQIFDPLGMSTAGDCIADKSPEDAVAYTRYALGPPRPALREGSGWYFAAGELCMTPSDLAKWDIAFLNKRILNKDSYREFTTKVKLKNGGSTHYALGLELGDREGVPAVYHDGEVSGFLAENVVFPSKNTAVVVCSNQDGTAIIFSVSRRITHLLFSSEPEASADELAQVRGILTGLAQGKIDRALFTSNANFYFNKQALDDYRKSLSNLGPLQSVTRLRESSRGGMSHRTYKAVFQNKAVNLNVYVTSEGKYEQFLVEEVFSQ